MRIFATTAYERAIRKLITDVAREEMESTIAAKPDGSLRIPGTGGIRKLRWAGSGRGKRGGIRVIYYYSATLDSVYMLTAYAKADRDDLTPTDKRVLSRLVAAIKKGGAEG
ncbi:MAG: hypothetical protein F4Y45_04800 [Acidobacteria bacterium]|nr:hypothetical protein [Acidobacteriota bacterium]MYJ05641.1 hypothetical protein [Acidobacteriota bacterium]